MLDGILISAKHKHPAHGHPCSECAWKWQVQKPTKRPGSPRVVVADVSVRLALYAASEFERRVATSRQRHAAMAARELVPPHLRPGGPEPARPQHCIAHRVHLLVLHRLDFEARRPACPAARLLVVQALVYGRCEREGVDSVLVANKSDLNDIVEAGPDAVADAFPGWRYEFVGRDLEALLRGDLAVGLDGPDGWPIAEG